MNDNMYKGFSLFNDIEDAVPRLRNRAVVLANIAEDNTKNRLISPKGAGLVLGYTAKLPKEDVLDVTEAFKNEMIRRGFKLV
jgi:hypothetical protein